MATNSTYRTGDNPACGRFRPRRRRHTGLGPFIWFALIIAASAVETWQSPAERGFAVLTLILVGIGTTAAAVLMLRNGGEGDRRGENGK